MSAVVTPRERIIAALAHEETDRVPVFDTPNNPRLFSRALGEPNYYSRGVPAARLSRALGMDACLVLEAGYTGLISEHRAWRDSRHFTDELNVQFAVTDSSWPLAVPERATLADRDAWRTVNLPDPCAEWRHREIKAAVEECHRGKEDDIAVLAGMRSSFSVLHISMGLENLAVVLYEDPGLLEEMVQAIGDFWTRSSVRAAELGADAVFIANDMGFNSQTIIAPDALRRLFIPQLKRQVAAIRQAGAKVILHSCGNINAILGDVVDAGIDCLNPLQVAAGMDIGEVKRRFGAAITVHGNVDSTGVMTSKVPGTIEAAVVETLRAAQGGGGHILATDHSFHMGIPLENVDAFLRAARTWGKYPLALPAAGAPGTTGQPHEALP